MCVVDSDYNGPPLVVALTAQLLCLNWCSSLLRWYLNLRILPDRSIQRYFVFFFRGPQIFLSFSEPHAAKPAAGCEP